nr:hypothetical protein GCM10025730_53950 [Promicromonospora thailandica]
MREACLLADDLGVRQRGGHLERQRRRLVERDDLGGDDLDLAGGQVGVGVALGTTADLARHLQHELGPQRVGDLLVPDHDLGDAGRVTQVDEGHSPVITAAIDPAREGDGLTDVLGPQ